LRADTIPGVEDILSGRRGEHHLQTPAHGAQQRGDAGGGLLQATEERVAIRRKFDVFLRAFDGAEELDVLKSLEKSLMIVIFPGNFDNFQKSIEIAGLYLVERPVAAEKSGPLARTPLRILITGREDGDEGRGGRDGVGDLGLPIGADV